MLAMPPPRATAAAAAIPPCKHKQGLSGLYYQVGHCMRDIARASCCQLNGDFYNTKPLLVAESL
jgi:hypothetical protein